MDREVFYLGIICSLLVVPRLLQRFRIPAPLTCMLLGLIVQLVYPTEGRIVHFAAVLGIASLFLFAGLEVRFSLMRRHAVSLAVFTLMRVAAIVGTTLVMQHLLNVAWQPACLIALALLTSSTGFILDSLDHFGIEGEDREVIASEAILGEILALLLLFFVLQSTAVERLALTTTALIALIAALPFVYYALVRWVLPYAPDSEFSLLVMVAIAAGFVTNRLGVEYLLGSFIAGVVAAQMHKRGFVSEAPDAMHAIKLFSSFFMPFYFFRAGQEMAHQVLSTATIAMALLFALLIPLRWLAQWLRYRLGRDTREQGQRLSLTLLPTLIFTLVLGQILRSNFNVDDGIVSGLVIYALLTTLLPSLLLHKPNPPAETTVEGANGSPPTKETAG